MPFMRRRTFPVLLTAVIGLFPLTLHRGAGPSSSLPLAHAAATGQPLRARPQAAGLSFEPNRGQFARGVTFVAQGDAYNLMLTATGAVIALNSAPAALPGASKRQAAAAGTVPAPARRVAVRMSLVGGNPAPRVVALDRLPGTVNYYIGTDPRHWRAGIPTYGRVEYRDVYPGIDLIYHSQRGQGQRLEYDVVVTPGADPRAIRLAFHGAGRVTLDGAGNLLLHTAAGVLLQPRPVAYQEVQGARRPVESRYVLGPGQEVGIRLGRYDASRPLVIDPVLAYSTYWGKGGDDAGYTIAVDGAGNAYVAGASNSGLSHYSGFVSKYTPAGQLVYTTYISGPCDSTINGIAVDRAGNVYTTGQYGAKSQYGYCVLDLAGVQKLDPAGKIRYNHQFGSRQVLVRVTNIGGSIAVDGAGNAYVTGRADEDFPTTTGALQTSGHDYDGFVLKLDPSGKTVYSTYLGGRNAQTGVPIDYGNGIAVDAAGDAYVAGTTQDSDFPTTAGAFQRSKGSSLSNAFVAKLNPTGSRLLYATYLGGNGGVPQADIAYGIALDTAGNAYVAGSTSSSTFPTTANAYDRTCGTDGRCNPVQVCDVGCHLAYQDDAFMAKIDPTLSGRSSLIYSTYLGGSTYDGAGAIAVSAAGHVYVTGWTSSSNFPVAHPIQRRLVSGQDVFVSVLDPARSGRSSLLFSTFLGGHGDDRGLGIAVDRQGNAYVTGYAKSTDFPTKHPAQRANAGGPADGFVAKIKM